MQLIHRAFIGMLLPILVTEGCVRQQQSADGSRSEARNRLSFRMHFTSQREGDCTGPGNGCAEIILHFPEIEKGDGPGAVDSINALIRSFVLSPFLENAPPDSLGTLLRQFIDSYRELQRSFPGSSSWTLERRAGIVRDTAGIVALEMRTYQFTGGAHPHTRTDYVNIDSRTGKRYWLADIVAAGKQKDCDAVAEKAFRALKSLSPEADLARSGYRFPSNTFHVNENFLLQTDTVLFYFNSYDIAPYAMGATALRIPKSALNGIVHY